LDLAQHDLESGASKDMGNPIAHGPGAYNSHDLDSAHEAPTEPALIRK
jgi:hypothetical protein